LVSQVLDREKIEEQKAVDYTSHIELAKRCATDRHFDAAVEHARKAISLDHTRPEAFNLLGALMEVRRNFLEAHRYYRAALELDPTYKPAIDNLSHSTKWPRGGGIVLDQTLGKGKNKKE
jgi:Flp pilus assembly protein TadD